MEHLIGRTIGQYRITEQLGQGGMATVYKAYQASLDRYVAVKILPPYFAHEPGFAQRFEREARAVARLNHPNILPIYDFGQEDDLSYIVIKYVEAGTLKDLISGPMPLDLTAEIIRQIASALDHAHQRGILHRDVKPSNVLLDDEHWVLLADFGLAKMVEGSVALTGSGVGVGTPAYMAPEQGRGDSVDNRADIYSLGIILYEMLTGCVPFQAETPMAVVVKHITDPLPLPRSLHPQIPDAVERIVLKALAKDPEDRFVTACAMADALDAAVAPVPTFASGVDDLLAPAVPAEAAFLSEMSTTPEVGATVPEATSLPTSQPPVPEAAPQKSTTVAAPVKRRFPWPVVGAVIGVIALALLAVWILGGIREARDAAETPSVAAMATATLLAPTSTPPPATSTAVATATPLPPTATATETSVPPTATRVPPTETPTRPPTSTATSVPTATATPAPSPTATRKPPTPTPALPGTETIPLTEMASTVPWLPLRENAIPGVHCFLFDATQYPFQDVRVRRAFALALDRRRIVDVVGGPDQARAATTFIHPQTLGRDLYGAVGLSFDPDRARRLLAEAGYPGGDSFPEIALTYHPNAQSEAFVNAAVAMWREHLGVEVRLDPMGNWDEYIARLRDDTPPLFRAGWRAEQNDPHSFVENLVDSGFIDRSSPGYDQIEQLANQAAVGGDPAKRQALYVRLEQILCQDEVLLIPLFHFWASN